MNKKITRRKFLGNTAKTSIGLALFSGLPAPLLAKKGANDIINIGVVGLNGHGSWAHLENSYLKMEGVRVIALCDPDLAVLNREAKKFYDRNEKVETYTDIRKLLDNKDIDVISGATPNHWHALSTVWACQAGKDVCVEKPVSHSIWEGRKMVEAAKKYNRIVQADLDIRSNMAMYDAIEYIKSGELGKVIMAHSWVYKRRKSIGKVNGSGYIPKTVDYDLWCGPAPMVSLPRINLHYDWHWQWDYGNGEIGNNGPHHLDVCRWALGYNDLPPRVISFGGRYGYSDDGQTPNTQITVLDYKPVPIIFEIRGLPERSDSNLMDSFSARSKNGIKVYHKADGASYNHASIIVCEGGYVDLGVEVGGPVLYDKNGNKVKEFKRERGYSSNRHFIEAVRSRNEGDIRTPIIEGHLSACLSHMGNISYRVGKEVPAEEVREVIKKDAEVVDAYERTREHLMANGVNLDETKITLGPWLKMDSSKERFVGPYSDIANKYLKREYREPFVIRDEV